MKKKNILLKGVGSFLTAGTNGEMVPIGSLECLRFEFIKVQDPVYGGDGLVPIGYITKKSVVVSATNVILNLDILRQMHSIKKTNVEQEMPLSIFVKIVHQGNFKQKGDIWQGIKTEIQLAKISNIFTLDYTRAIASKPSVALQLIDPEDGTCRLWTMKRFVTDVLPHM